MLSAVSFPSFVGISLMSELPRPEGRGIQRGLPFYPVKRVGEYSPFAFNVPLSNRPPTVENNIFLEAESKACTSQTCPERGGHKETVHHEETPACSSGFEAHADLTASETFLRENSDTEARPMALPVRFECDKHD